jgi:hypothetical protein
MRNAHVVTGPNSGSVLLDNCQNLLLTLANVFWSRIVVSGLSG